MNTLTWFLAFTTAVFLVSTIWLGLTLDMARHMRSHYKVSYEVLRREHTRIQHKYRDLRFELSWLAGADE